MSLRPSGKTIYSWVQPALGGERAIQQRAAQARRWAAKLEIPNDLVIVASNNKNRRNRRLGGGAVYAAAKI